LDNQLQTNCALALFLANTNAVFRENHFQWNNVEAGLPIKAPFFNHLDAGSLDREPNIGIHFEELNADFSDSSNLDAPLLKRSGVQIEGTLVVWLEN
jgi:hypothetical protein